MPVMLGAAIPSPNVALRSRDGTSLAGRKWRAGAPRAVVALVHGYADHSGRYAHVAEFLGEAGVSVVAVDLRGHGASAGKRGHVASFDEYLDDVDALLAEAGREAARGAGGGIEGGAGASAAPVPVFLVGHSMGGLVSLLYAMRRGGDFRGLAVSSPFLGVGIPVPPVKAALGRVMSAAWPSLAMGSGINPRNLSHDPEVARAYADDPLVFKTATARWFTEALAAIDEVRRRAGELRKPCLILQAGEDRLCDPKASGPVFEAMGADDKTFIDYPGLYHEIFNETERERPLGDLRGWIEARI